MRVFLAAFGRSTAATTGFSMTVSAALSCKSCWHGDFAGFLQGGESVFYYGGPGLRYFRAIEHIFFGESYLGYLSLVLLFPFLVYRLFRRFLPGDWSLALTFVFIAIPVGAVFGTSFVHYAQLAARGFADPAAYILFVAGMLPIIGQPGESAEISLRPFLARCCSRWRSG